MRIPLKLIGALSAVVVAACASVNPSKPENVAIAAESELALFAVEIKVGPNWDAAKPPNEQALFSEHSANLKRLREAGHIVMGARYSDIGLIIFSAASSQDIRGMMARDPSIAAGTFTYKVHPLYVFYPGLVQSGVSRKGQ